MSDQLSLLDERVQCRVSVGQGDRLDIATRGCVYVACVVHGNGGIMRGDPLTTVQRVRHLCGLTGRGVPSTEALRVYTRLTGEHAEWVDVAPCDVVSVQLHGGAL